MWTCGREARLPNLHQSIRWSHLDGDRSTVSWSWKFLLHCSLELCTWCSFPCYHADSTQVVGLHSSGLVRAPLGILTALLLHMLCLACMFEQRKGRCPHSLDTMLDRLYCLSAIDPQLLVSLVDRAVFGMASALPFRAIRISLSCSQCTSRIWSRSIFDLLIDGSHIQEILQGHRGREWRILSRCLSRTAQSAHCDQP